MLRTFNCGFGMAVLVAAEHEHEAFAALALAELSPTLIGRLVARENLSLSCSTDAFSL